MSRKKTLIVHMGQMLYLMTGMDRQASSEVSNITG